MNWDKCSQLKTLIIGELWISYYSFCYFWTAILRLIKLYIYIYIFIYLNPYDIYIYIYIYIHIYIHIYIYIYTYIYSTNKWKKIRTINRELSSQKYRIMIQETFRTISRCQFIPRSIGPNLFLQNLADVRMKCWNFKVF